MYTRRTIEVKTDLNSAVDAYFVCMRSGVTENLFSDSLALKVQLSTVISFVNTSIRNLKPKMFEESSLIFCGKKSTEKFDDSFEDRQLALGGGIQLTSLWLDIVLWRQIGLYRFLK